MIRRSGRGYYINLCVRILLMSDCKRNNIPLTFPFDLNPNFYQSAVYYNIYKYFEKK